MAWHACRVVHPPRGINKLPTHGDSLIDAGVVFYRTYDGENRVFSRSTKSRRRIGANATKEGEINSLIGGLKDAF